MKQREKLKERLNLFLKYVNNICKVYVIIDYRTSDSKELSRNNMWP